MMAAPLLPFEVAEFRRRRRPVQGRPVVFWILAGVLLAALIVLGRCA